MSTNKDDPTSHDTALFEPITKELMPQAGDHLGYCRIIELIAAGGMANVYKVWHEQLEVIRAIKILKPGYNDESKGRLETEAKISANLHHINIVEIYGIGYWNSIPYIEMEYVDGPSLKDLLEKNGCLPVPFAISLTHAVCSALQFAHNQDLTLYGKVYDGLVHRDIKPANILISSKGIVKLADFGIARPSEVSLHTVGGKVMGTFAYLSPEQLNGERLDQRTDIYALGTVFYEMLTGIKTFPQRMLAELIHRKTQGQYIPVNSLNKSISKHLCNIVDKSLELDKNKRYPDALEFDKELVSTLKKATSRNPEDIIHQYIKEPVPIPKNEKPLSIKKTTPFIATVLFVIILISAGVFFVDRYWDNFFSEKQITETPTPSQMHIIPPPAVDSLPSRIEQHLATRRPAAVLQPNNSQIQFEKAIRAYKNGDYKMVISQLENTPINELDPQKQNLYSVRLMQAYYNTGDMDKALSFSESLQNADGLVHFLRAEILYKRDQYEKAEIEYKSARTMQSQYDNNIAKNASLSLARIRDALYLLKPNMDNKQLCIRAWSAFLDIYCTGDQTPDCQEANKKLERLHN